MPTRNRNRGSQLSRQATITYTRYGPTSPSWYSGYTTWSANIGSGSVEGTYETMTDVVGSGFRSGLPPQKWVNNPMSRTVSRMQRLIEDRVINCAPNANGQYLSAKLSGDYLSVFAGLLTAPASAATEETNAINKALIECLNRIETPKTQAIVSIAEFGKTTKMIRQAASKLQAVMFACKRADLKELRRLLPHTRRRPVKGRYVVWGNDGEPVVLPNGRIMRGYSWSKGDALDSDRLSIASRLWLEYRYGWRVLVYEIIDTLKAWHADKLRSELRQVELKRATGKGKFSTDTSSTGTVTSSGRTWTIRTETWKTAEASSFVYYKTDESWGNLQRLNDFGVFEVPRALWELTPLSFVADWIAPIGDWLGALTPKFGVNFVSSGTVYSVSRKAQRTVTNYSYSGSTAATGDNFNVHSLITVGNGDLVEEYKKVRTTGVGTPSYPPIEVKLNLSRLTDAFALIRGFSSRGSLRI